MIDNMSVFELLESAMEKIKRDYQSNWLLTDADWDPSACIPQEDIPRLQEKMPYGPFHMHPFFEITILLEGKQALRLRDVAKKMEPGDVFLLLPGQNHQDMPYQNNRHLAMWIAFEPGEVRVHLSGHNKAGEFFLKGYYSLDIDYALYNGLLYDMQKEIRNHSRWSYDILKINVMNLLIIVNRHLEQEKGIDGSEGWKAAIVKSVIRYIEDNYQRNPTLSDISHHFGISMNYMNSIFKCSTGKTVINYSNDYKIVKAKELLRATQMRVKEIALFLGFYDQYHFCKAFKRTVGISPTEFRKSPNTLL